MIERLIKNIIKDSLKNFPVAGLIGARQVGKTTLAKYLAEEMPKKAIYLDLERPSDLAKLQESELYLESHSHELVILDEIQRKPELFPVLRSLIDDNRRKGRFLILGSASPALIRKSSESLAGRIVYHELYPLTITEIDLNTNSAQKLWLRGGYPESYLAHSEQHACQWREAFIQTHLERDLPVYGISIPAVTLRRFWTMLAHSHGQLWNASKIASSLGVSAPAVKKYLDILSSTFMIRQLTPYFSNVKKRLVKSPKIYLRDSGLLHSLLRIEDWETLLGHPAAGPSWEGWVIEQIGNLVPQSWGIHFYRTSAGAEIDLVLQPPSPSPLIAVEIKRTLEPKLTKGYRSAFADLRCEKGFFIYPGNDGYPLDKNVDVLPVSQIHNLLDACIPKR